RHEEYSIKNRVSRFDDNLTARYTAVNPIRNFSFFDRIGLFIISMQAYTMYLKKLFNGTSVCRRITNEKQQA
ncbi:MAG: hypothetical protein ACE5NM_13725, partial [Sedimentisphaerales bacterium]